MDLVLDVVTLDEIGPARFGQKRVDLVPAGVGLGPVVRLERNRLGRLLRSRTCFRSSPSLASSSSFTWAISARSPVGTCSPA